MPLILEQQRQQNPTKTQIQELQSKALTANIVLMIFLQNHRRDVNIFCKFFLLVADYCHNLIMIQYYFNHISHLQ